jgi:hypothetical protein
MNHYRSEQVHYTTTPMDGQPFGMRNTIVIDGPVAYKEHAEMDQDGSLLFSRKHRLTKKEQKAIQTRSFIPELWHCCKKNKQRIKTRKAAKARALL